MTIQLDGFVPPAQLRGKRRRRLLIGSEGPPDSGKTEFILSIPGPGAIIAVDRGFEAMLDNPHPPAARRNDYLFHVVKAPKAGQAMKDKYLEYWKAFYDKYKAALAHEAIQVVGVDGDSDTWELQRLAQWGKLTQVPSIMYTQVNAARRVMYARAFDSGKTVVMTNKIKKEYEDVFEKDGKPKMGDDGRQVREWRGKYERQGFNDQEYLFQVQLRHMTKYDKDGTLQYGIRILKCKADMELIGFELWGDQCNYRGLIETIYPHIDPREFGFTS